jgi:hypothetical protein
MAQIFGAGFIGVTLAMLCAIVPAAGVSRTYASLNGGGNGAVCDERA